MFRHAIAVGAVCALACAGSVATAAQQTPTNEQLYRMLLQQQKRIQRLERRAGRAERALKKARATIRAYDRRRRTAAKSPAAATVSATVRSRPTGPRRTARRPDRSADRQVATREPAAPNRKTGGIFTLGGPLFLQPNHSLLGFGIVSANGSTPPTSTGSPVESVNPSFTPGGRLGLGYAVPDTGLDFRATLAFLRGDWSRTLTAPTGGSILAVLSDPAATGADDANVAVANYRFRYHVADAEIGQKLRLGTATKVRLLFGLRFARISEELQVDYIGRNFGSVGDRVTTSSRFWGIGPRIGADLKWRLPRMGGLFLAGNMDAALLLGQFDTARSQVRRDAGVTLVSVSQRNQASLVPALGGRLALGWRGRVGSGAWLSAELGYQFQSFIGGTRRIGFVDDSNGAATETERDDLLLHGPYLQMKLRFYSFGQLFDLL